MAAPDPIVIERQMYLDMLEMEVDDPSYSMSDLRNMTGGGTNAHRSVSSAFADDVALNAPVLRKGSSITPDDFKGSDAERLQAAVDFCVNNGYPVIIFNRLLDLTGASPIVVNKNVWSNRNAVVFEGMGGGIAKHGAGVVFTSDAENTGDLIFKSVEFVSASGAGAVLLDCDKLIRCYSVNNDYRNWDLIARQTTVGRYAQSMRFIGDRIIGGSGPAFLFRESYDCVFDDILCEDRVGGFFANDDGAMTSIANRALRITNTVIENCSGIPIQLAMCWSALIEGNYFEFNGAATDPQIDLNTLATLSAQSAVSIIGNMVTQKTVQREVVPAILLGNGRPKDQITSIGNISEGGYLYKFAVSSSSGIIVGSGDYVENAGFVIYPGQEHRYISQESKSVTTAARPKNPRLGDTYFDTTLGYPIWPKTVGTVGTVSLQINGGATTSGDITITIFGVPYVVAVTAGDTNVQVRDKIVASVATFFPTWKTRSFSTSVAAFDTPTPGGPISGALSFSGGTTGVTQNYFGIDVLGTDPTWVNATGTTV